MQVTVTSSAGGLSQRTGEIIVWGRSNGGSTGDAHGRFTGNPIKPAPGQFHTDDVLSTACAKTSAAVTGRCDSCSTLAEFSSCSRIVTQACCGGPGDKCVGGQPLACDEECDDVLIPMQKHCAAFLAKTPGMTAIGISLAKAVKICPKSGGH